VTWLLIVVWCAQEPPKEPIKQEEPTKISCVEAQRPYFSVDGVCYLSCIPDVSRES